MHVLAVRLDNDGDVLLMGPAVRALAARAERVTLLCGRRGAAAGRLLPGAEQVLEFTAPWIDPEPAPVDRTAIEGLVTAVEALQVDAAVIFTSFHQSPLPTALVLRLAGVPFVAALSEDYPGSLLDVRHHVEGDVHEVERALSLAAAAGFPHPPDDDLRLRIRPVTTPTAAAPYVVVHPGSSAPARTWPPRRFRELVLDLEAAGFDPVVTGGPRERDLTAAVCRDARRTVDLGGETSLAQLAGVLAGASAVVCGNTGPAHLAAAVGTPVVSIFPPTVPAARWRPWRVPHVLLGDQQVTCAGCRSLRCPLPVQACVADVRPADVHEALLHLLDVCGSREAGLNQARTMREVT